MSWKPDKCARSIGGDIMDAGSCKLRLRWRRGSKGTPCAAALAISCAAAMAEARAMACSAISRASLVSKCEATWCHIPRGVRDRLVWGATHREEMSVGGCNVSLVSASISWVCLAGSCVFLERIGKGQSRKKSDCTVFSVKDKSRDAASATASS